MLSVDTLQTVEIRVGWGTDKHFSDQEHMYDQFFCFYLTKQMILDTHQMWLRPFGFTVNP